MRDTSLQTFCGLVWPLITVRFTSQRLLGLGRRGRQGLCGQLDVATNIAIA